MDCSQIQEEVCAVLAPYDVHEAYLYGSYARGTNKAGSDIDLRFLCGDEMDFIQLYEIQKLLEDRLGVAVDITTAPPEQMRASFYDRVKQDEVKLYASV